MMRHCWMDGPTGGILIARPCHVSRVLALTTSPHSVATTDRFCFIVPRAMNVCVWVMKALGTMDLDVALSNSANTGMTSPAAGGRGLLEPAAAFRLLGVTFMEDFLTWSVTFAVNLCGYGHLSKVTVPRPCQLVLRPRLRSLKININQ